MLELSERVRTSDQPREQKRWVALQHTLTHYGVHNLTDTNYGGFNGPISEAILSLASVIGDPDADDLDMKDEGIILLVEMTRHFLAVLPYMRSYKMDAEHLRLESELNSRGYWFRDDYPLRVGDAAYAMTEDRPSLEVAFSLHRVNPFKRFHVYCFPKPEAVKNAYDDVIGGIFDEEYADAEKS